MSGECNVCNHHDGGGNEGMSEGLTDYEVTWESGSTSIVSAYTVTVEGDLISFWHQGLILAVRSNEIRLVRRVDRETP